VTDEELYARGAATLVASWEAYARGAGGAALRRLDGVCAAVFPDGPESAVYNNALIERGLAPAARTTAIAAMESAYRSAGVARYAAWVHERDEEMRNELERRGYAAAESTRAMGMRLDAAALPAPAIAIEPLAWSDYLAFLWTDGAPAGLLSGADPSAFEALGAQRGGELLAAGLAFDHEGDCGVFNVATHSSARRRGLGTAITARLVRDAAARGCTTATLQATPVAERVYGAVGFRDLGRFLEYAPRRGC